MFKLPNKDIKMNLFVNDEVEIVSDVIHDVVTPSESTIDNWTDAISIHDTPPPGFEKTNNTPPSGFKNPDRKTRSLCHSVYRGGKCTKDNCPYMHSAEELTAHRQPHPLYKSRNCIYYDMGNCSLGKFCTYKHNGEDDEYLIQNKSSAAHAETTPSIKGQNKKIRLSTRNSLEILTYENANQLGDALGVKITCMEMFLPISEEVISFAMNKPKLNIIYFVNMFKHERIFETLNMLIRKQIDIELRKAENIGCSTKALEHLGLLVGQYLVIKSEQLEIYITNPIESLLNGYYDNLGMVSIPFFVSIATIYARIPEQKKSKPTPANYNYHKGMHKLLSILEKLLMRGMIPRHLSLRIMELINVADKNGGFPRIKWTIENPSVMVIKKYKPCEKLMFGGCEYGDENCLYDHSFVLKFIQSSDGTKLLEKAELKIVSLSQHPPAAFGASSLDPHAKEFTPTPGSAIPPGINNSL